MHTYNAYTVLHGRALFPVSLAWWSGSLCTKSFMMSAKLSIGVNKAVANISISSDVYIFPHLCMCVYIDLYSYACIWGSIKTSNFFQNIWALTNGIVSQLLLAFWYCTNFQLILVLSKTLLTSAFRRFTRWLPTLREQHNRLHPVDDAKQSYSESPRTGAYYRAMGCTRHKRWAFVVHTRLIRTFHEALRRNPFKAWRPLSWSTDGPHVDMLRLLSCSGHTGSMSRCHMTTIMIIIYDHKLLWPRLLRRDVPGWSKRPEASGLRLILPLWRSFKRVSHCQRPRMPE